MTVAATDTEGWPGPPPVTSPETFRGNDGSAYRGRSPVELNVIIETTRTIAQKAAAFLVTFTVKFLVTFMENYLVGLTLPISISDFLTTNVLDIDFDVSHKTL
jgi:hypothetical protein